jgi:glutamate decarboxylase
MENSVLNCMTSQSILLQNCAVESTGKFTILSEEIEVPSVASPSRIELSMMFMYEIAHGLREYGWTLPADTMAPDVEKVNLLQVVVT